MKKTLGIIIFSLAGQCIANTSVCPTCPKDIVMSKMEEMYITPKQEKGLASQSKFKHQIDTNHLAKISRVQKTPVEILANKADQLKKVSSSSWKKKETTTYPSSVEGKGNNPWPSQTVKAKDVEDYLRNRAIFKKMR
jgi:hypothetical protein